MDPRLDKRPGAQDRASVGVSVSRGKEVADKERRSFLRRAERLPEYNTKGTVCQCLFNV
jgi:hypothetical protein